MKHLQNFFFTFVLLGMLITPPLMVSSFLFSKNDQKSPSPVLGSSREKVSIRTDTNEEVFTILLSLDAGEVLSVRDLKIVENTAASSQTFALSVLALPEELEANIHFGEGQTEVSLFPESVARVNGIFQDQRAEGDRKEYLIKVVLYEPIP
jgi:hypothetical protein